MSNAAQSGRFRIGDAFEVNRLGFGAMRIVGRGIWGPPQDRAEALRTLRRLPDLGVEIIDLWQLHRIDPKAPANEQFDAIRTLIRDKVIRCAGLSEVSVAEI